MGLLVDYRQQALQDDFNLALTGNGVRFYNVVKPLLNVVDLSFNGDDYSLRMNCESTVNNEIRNFISQEQELLNSIRSILLEMDAVNLLLKYLYSIQRKPKIQKSEIYTDFFEAPFVKAYLDRHGLENPTKDVRERRIPFLINILDALGIVNQLVREIEMLAFIPAKEVLRLDISEKDDVVQSRAMNLKTFIETGQNNFSANEISLLKETFGSEFLTQQYYLPVQQI